MQKRLSLMYSKLSVFLTAKKVFVMRAFQKKFVAALAIAALLPIFVAPAAANPKKNLPPGCFWLSNDSQNPQQQQQQGGEPQQQVPEAGRPSQVPYLQLLAGGAGASPSDPRKAAILGYKAQSARVLEHVDRLLTGCEARRQSIVVEGVHLSLR